MDFSQSLFSCCILATLSNIVEIHWCFTQILFAFTAKDFSSILSLFRLTKLNFLQNTFFQCTKQTCCEIWVHKTLYKETISHISTQHCSCWTWFSVTDAAVESAQPSFCTARCLNLVTPNLPPVKSTCMKLFAQRNLSDYSIFKICWVRWGKPHKGGPEKLLFQQTKNSNF